MADGPHAGVDVNPVFVSAASNPSSSASPSEAFSQGAEQGLSTLAPTPVLPHRSATKQHLHGPRDPGGILTDTSFSTSTSLPAFIKPPVSQFTPNSTLVQLAFLAQLNYNFVSSNSSASAQIFDILPLGLSYGLGIDHSNVVMHGLHPFNSTERSGYITTVAEVYIPSDSVTNLTISIPLESSPLYHNPNETQHALMGLVDPGYSVIVQGSASAGDDTANNTSASATASLASATASSSASTSNSASISSSTGSPNVAVSQTASLPPGAIAGIIGGIVITIIVLITLAAGTTVFCLRHKRRKKPQIVTNTPDSELNYGKGDFGVAQTQELDAVNMQLDGNSRSEADGNPRSEAPGQIPGPGFISEVPVGGPGQGFIVEMPDSSRRGVETKAMGKRKPRSIR